MKVQLVLSLPSLGRDGQIVEVSDAQARNYLFPKKLAIPATVSIVAAQQRQEADRQQRQQKRASQLTALGQRIAGSELKLFGKANPQGKLFAALKAIDIQQALEKQFRIKLPGLQTTPNHLKTVGLHSVAVVLDDHQTAVINVIIEHVP